MSLALACHRVQLYPTFKKDYRETPYHSLKTRRNYNYKQQKMYKPNKGNKQETATHQHHTRNNTTTLSKVQKENYQTNN